MREVISARVLKKKDVINGLYRSMVVKATDLPSSSLITYITANKKSVTVDFFPSLIMRPNYLIKCIHNASCLYKMSL